MADYEGPKNLLIADSDTLVRHALAEYLRHCGYRVVEATNFDEVISILERPEDGVLPDIVLCDVGLTGGNGFALRVWVRAHRPEVRVVLAGNVAAAARAAGELCEEGPDLGRPYDPQLVLDQIRRMKAPRLQ
ncbi:response regulator [Novosphingobium flavum]|uniref:Response regulator n=1 Tax=Novosphingobium flavum TaxID=1778672 RepID=A0A7X1KM32_9SPHN|nr:response regulator [Novosphingobium flavum]MBC2666209.1 response regulator [Novosphingobium flavum]